MIDSPGRHFFGSLSFLFYFSWMVWDKFSVYRLIPTLFVDVLYLYKVFCVISGMN